MQRGTCRYMLLYWHRISFRSSIEFSMQVIDRSKDAFELTIRDPAIRAYLQRYPFLIGPDAQMNERGRRAINDGLAARSSTGTGTAVTRLLPHETQLTELQVNRLRRIMDASEVPESARAEMVDDFGWEAKLVPPETKDVLVLGCGDGTELMFLRAVLPEAKITALDYQDQVPESRKRATGVRFMQGDMDALLADFGPQFDLISSNHTLEHLYTPDTILATLAGLLGEGGALISTLPMDGTDGSPFLAKVKQAARNKTSHPLDVVYLDAGHPWKTNPTDLDETLRRAGFERPLLYQRQQHLSRYAGFGERRFKAEMAVGKVLHGCFFGGPRSLAKVLLSEKLQKIFGRGLLAAERRMWFGTNQLKNRYTQEVLVLARKK